MSFPRNRSFDVGLATRIGLNEALFLAQLDFWISNSDKGIEVDGVLYIDSTFENWHKQFPFWSLRTLNTVVTRCKREGYVRVVKVGPGYNQTRGYRINYDHEALSIVQKLHNPLCKNDPIHDAESAQSTFSKELEEGEEPLPVNGNGKDAMKIEDVELPGDFDLEFEIDKLAGRVDHGPSMGAFWQSCLSGYGHAIKTQGTLNPAKWTKLKSIMSFIDGPERLAGVLKDWNLFRAFAQQQYDMKLPVKPTIEKVHMAKEAIMEFSAPEPVEVDESDFKTVDDML